MQEIAKKKDPNREEKFANSLKIYLHKEYFPKSEFKIAIDVRNKKDDWADVVVYRKKDNEPTMLIETKADNYAYNVIGEALWKQWDIFDKEKKDVPTFIAVDNAHFKGRDWDPKTIKRILQHYRTRIGVLVKKGRIGFEPISDPRRFLRNRLQNTQK